ncbi:hypothetical protein PWT90_11010 [Aphanocladium album]|nr:hypothetical protein PWT90_11010 [Aphanocladium album]
MPPQPVLGLLYIAARHEWRQAQDQPALLVARGLDAAASAALAINETAAVNGNAAINEPARALAAAVKQGCCMPRRRPAIPGRGRYLLLGRVTGVARETQSSIIRSTTNTTRMMCSGRSMLRQDDTKDVNQNSNAPKVVTRAAAGRARRQASAAGVQRAAQ